jgi:hypothetical protein
MPLFENNVVKDNAKDLKNKVESHLPSFSQANSKAGSGSEVDRFGSHFGLGADGRARIKAAAGRAATHQGLGAEQDIHASHFGLDIEEVKKVLKRVERRADKEIHAGRHWMGHDGHQRMLSLASKQGVGAEQVSILAL